MQLGFVRPTGFGAAFTLSCLLACAARSAAAADTPHPDGTDSAAPPQPLLAWQGQAVKPLREPRQWQVSAAAGLFSRSEVVAHLSTHTEPALSFHVDATLPGPLLDFGVYFREVTLRSSESGGTAVLVTAGGVVKYERRIGRGWLARAGLLVGVHDLSTDTIDDAIGLDLGGTLEAVMRASQHVRLRYAVQGTSMVVGHARNRIDVTFQPTVATTLGVEYAFRP